MRLSRLYLAWFSNDWYLVTEKWKGDNGPTTNHTKVGWVLLGPLSPQEIAVNLVFSFTHTLHEDRNLSKIDTFWINVFTCNITQSAKVILGFGVIRYIKPEEEYVMDKFVPKVRFDE